MPFNEEKFDQVKIQDRTAKVPVPELKMFFDEKEEPVWVVRALGSLEVAIAREAKEKNQNFQALIERLLSEVTEDKVDSILELLGLAKQGPDSDAPEDYVWRISLLQQGSVTPEINQEQAVRLALMNSVVFYKLTGKILQLIGEGQELGE